jgi:hypothetical protein
MEHDKQFYESIMQQSCSLQGFYGRFYHLEYEQWTEDYQNEFVDALKDSNVESLFDYIMFMES